MSDRYQTIHTDRVLPSGVTKLADDPGYRARVLALVITADVGCRVRFASGTTVHATFYVGQGTPLVLPYNEEGWWIFDSGRDINADVLGPGTPSAAIQVVWIREE